MSQVRLPVRRRAIELLADEDAGFNAMYALLPREDVGSLYGYGYLPSIEINWEAGSANFFQGQISDEALDVLQIEQFPCVQIYTSLTENTGAARFHKFSGQVLLHIEFDLNTSLGRNPSGGLEADNTEGIGDAIEDALIEVFSVPNIAWPSLPDGGDIGYSGNIVVPRPPVRLLGDGWAQKVPMILRFNVDN